MAPAEAAPSAAVADALTRSVRAAGGRGVALADLEAVAVLADPTLAAAPDRRARLAAAIDHLADAGVLRLPSDASAWDHTGRPPLPAWVRPPVGAVAAGRPARRGGPAPASLRPELAAARTLGHLSAEELDVLDAVNAWLARGGPRLVVPHRERSLELFGDEKRLDSLSARRLFTQGVLSFSLLGCEWVPPQLPWRRVGPGDVAVVVENAATFRTLTNLLSDDPGRYGVVASGGGNAFVRTVAGLAEVGGLSEVRYFGDLDVAGLEIPARAAAEATRADLPAPRPAVGLYRLLLDTAAPQPVDGAVDAGRAGRAAAWLGDLAAPALGVLLRPARLAQEAVGAELLTDRPDALER